MTYSEKPQTMRLLSVHPKFTVTFQLTKSFYLKVREKKILHRILLQDFKCIKKGLFDIGLNWVYSDLPQVIFVSHFE